MPPAMAPNSITIGFDFGAPVGPAAKSPGAESGTACETYSKVADAAVIAALAVGDRNDVSRDGVDEKVTTSSGWAATLLPGDTEAGRVMKLGSSGARADAAGVVLCVTMETPPTGVGVKMDGSISGDPAAAAAGFGVSASARNLAIASTRLADTGTCVRAGVARNSVSRAAMLLCGERTAGRAADGAIGASIPYNATPSPLLPPPRAPVGTRPWRASASAVLGDALPSIIAT